MDSKSLLDRGSLVRLQDRLAEGPLDLSRSQVVELVAIWVREKTPAAVVRFGEGEGRLLVADAANAPSIGVAQRKLRRQTGQIYSPAETLQIKSLVMHALDEADVVGIRGSTNFADEHQMWVERIERVFEERITNGRKPAYVSHCLVSVDLRDALPRLLAGQRIASIISCRNLKSKIESTYGVLDARVYQIPSQYVKREVDDEYETALHGVPIWPEFYDRLYQEISVRERGEVFLVGAGLFGKDLCIRIRDLGGIALDLGSCLDFMAGKITRGSRKRRENEPTEASSAN